MVSARTQGSLLADIWTIGDHAVSRVAPTTKSKLVQDYALDWIELSLPRRPLEHLHCSLVTRVPAHADSTLTEIDILHVVLIFETRRHEGHKVHLRYTPITGEFAHCLALAHIIRQKANQLIDDVAQPVGLLQPSNVARNSARVLNILLTVEHFPD